MTEDHVLRELGHLAKEEVETEQDRLDERWDRLAAGTLSAEEEAELRALAEKSPEAREAYEAFRPLGADFQARVVGALAAEMAGQPAAEPEKPRARVLPFRSRTLRLAPWVTAAAAAAGLFLLLRDPSSLPPLPAYTASLSGEVKTFRGETAAESEKVFIPGSRLKLVVQPETSVAGSVEARAFLARDSQIVAWEPEPPLAIFPQGTVTLEGTVGEEIRLARGPWRVWIVAGRPGKIPSAEELENELRAGRTQTADWQAVSQALRIEDQPPP